MDNSLKIESCQSCGKSHNDVSATKLVGDQSPFTHWFTCPETGDPQLMTIQQRDAGSHGTTMDAIEKALHDAARAERYMVAVFHMENGKQILHRTSHQFPVSEFDSSVKLLKENLEDEIGPPARQTLSIASMPPPTVTLFEGENPIIVDGDIDNS